MSGPDAGSAGAVPRGGAPGFRRVVSRWAIVGLALNDVIGSGVYLLPAAAAAILGSASVWGVLAAGGAVLLLVLCFAEAARHFEEPGGAYLYARSAWGPFWGFEVGWMTWLARVATLASLSAGFSQALSYLWPAATEGSGRVIAIVAPLLVLTALNVFGILFGARTANVLLIGKLLPLAVFLVVGLTAFSPARAFASAPIRVDRLGEAALLLMFAYAGFENTAAPAGEYRKPKSDVPFALLMQALLVTLLYSAVQLVAQGVLPDLASSQTPLADAAKLLLPSFGGALLTVGAVASILGTMGNTVLSGPRYLFALADDGFGPRALAKIHPRYATPAVAIVAQTAVVIPLALTGTFTSLAALSVVARLTGYIATAAAVPVLQRRARERGEMGRGLPAAVPVAAVLVCLGLAASATFRNLVAGVVALALGAVVFALRRGKPEDRA